MTPRGRKALVILPASFGVAIVLLMTCVSPGCDLFAALLGRDARVERAKIDVQRIASDGVEAFKAARGRYPTTEEGLEILLGEGFLRPNTKDGALVDPWGREYVYRYPGQKHADSFDVMTYGADGKPGGRGADADIVN